MQNGWSRRGDMGACAGEVCQMRKGCKKKENRRDTRRNGDGWIKWLRERIREEMTREHKEGEAERNNFVLYCKSPCNLERDSIKVITITLSFYLLILMWQWRHLFKIMKNTISN